MTATTGFRYPSLTWWPLISVTPSWEEPQEVEVAARRSLGQGPCEELITPRLRNEATRIVRRFIVEDVWGLARLGLPLVQHQLQLRFIPSRTPVTAHVIHRMLGGEALSHPNGPVGGELLEMRRYVHGDPLRYVIWKAFARSRKLLVRTHEQAITPRPSGVAYLVAGPGDEATAGAARFFLEEGLLGQSFIFCADGATAATTEIRTALEQIVASVRFREAGGEGLGRFLGLLSPRQREACLLFVPPLPGAWLERVARVASKIKGACVITTIDEQPYSAQRRSWRRFFFSDQDALHASLLQLGQVVVPLQKMGFDVYVLHRPSGELMSKAQIATVLERIEA
jgi:hypothetical protein